MTYVWRHSRDFQHRNYENDLLLSIQRARTTRSHRLRYMLRSPYTSLKNGSFRSLMK